MCIELLKANHKSKEFFDCIEDLISHSDVADLNNFDHHISTTRLDHCVHVAYYSYIVSKKFKMDHVSATRAGLLHDLYHVKNLGHSHLSSHPKLALINAEQICDVNPIVSDAILKHMWPLTTKPPAYKESYVVNLCDKFASAIDIGKHLKKKFHIRHNPRFRIDTNTN